MSFGMIILNQSIDAMQNYTTWIHIVHIKTEAVYEDIKMMLKKYLKIKSDWNNER